MDRFDDLPIELTDHIANIATRRNRPKQMDQQRGQNHGPQHQRGKRPTQAQFVALPPRDPRGSVYALTQRAGLNLPDAKDDRLFRTLGGLYLLCISPPVYNGICI